MTFSYKGIDRDDALDLPVGGTSLYALAKANDAVYAKLLAHFRSYKADFDKHAVAEGTVRFISMLELFMHVARFQAYKDGERPYYNQGSALFTLLTFSYTPALGFATQLDRQKSLADAFTAVQQSGVTAENELVAGLRGQGLARAWAEEIAARGVAGVEAELAKYAKWRAATAKIVLALKADDVQLGWKIVGSCLGIDHALLPTTYADAATLWSQFVLPGYPRVVAANDTLVAGRTAMIDTFEEALDIKKLWDKADLASFGITLKASAITETSYVGPIARIIGWYTSSNHAGYTCSACKTVHGSRVSLVRLWHRCPTCAKVYCPQCASGMALYAGMILGALAGWWSIAGSLLYAGTIGWVIGSTTGHATSKFAARKCCGTQTEALY